ncbi:MAG: zinc-dependent alcohol dehydrogenase [Solirubrobacteraceae bacterium]
MRAVLTVGPGQMRVVDDWPEPAPDPGEVVVQMTALGICGSDLAVWSGHRPPPELPWIVGHEAIGTVVSLAPDVTGHALGDRVVIEPNYPCGRCSSCLAGRTSTCPARAIVGINSPGLLRERAAVPAAFAWPAPIGVADEDLVCAEPVAVAQTAVSTSRLGAGDRCLVLGAGAQGLFVCQLARAIGGEVAVIEPQPARLELARALGARPADEQDQYPFVFETSGTGAGVRTALQRVEPGGTVVLIGIPHQDVPVPIATVVRNQVRVIGSLIYDHPQGFARTLELLAQGDLAPSRVLGARFEIESGPEALAAAATLAGKAWISFASAAVGSYSSVSSRPRELDDRP